MARPLAKPRGRAIATSPRSFLAQGFPLYPSRKPLIASGFGFTAMLSNPYQPAKSLNSKKTDISFSFIDIHMRHIDAQLPRIDIHLSRIAING
jgi:hypothetical protein